MKKLIYSFLIVMFANIYAQCNPLEVALYISQKDGWMFPYSAFYNGITDGTQEIIVTNPECAELLDNNESCINNCLYMDEEEVNMYLGRIGCLFYTCPDGILLVHNYDELTERPVHVYGQYYCSEDTEWNEEQDVCTSAVCNGDLDANGGKDIIDIIMLVDDILTGEDVCE